MTNASFYLVDCDLDKLADISSCKIGYNGANSLGLEETKINGDHAHKTSTVIIGIIIRTLT